MQPVDVHVVYCQVWSVGQQPHLTKKNLEKNLGKLLTFKQLKQKLDKLMQNLR